jgi:hypothetical protein
MLAALFPVIIVIPVTCEPPCNSLERNTSGHMAIYPYQCPLLIIWGPSYPEKGAQEVPVQRYENGEIAACHIAGSGNGTGNRTTKILRIFPC